MNALAQEQLQRQAGVHPAPKKRNRARVLRIDQVLQFLSTAGRVEEALRPLQGGLLLFARVPEVGLAGPQKALLRAGRGAATAAEKAPRPKADVVSCVAIKCLTAAMFSP